MVNTTQTEATDGTPAGATAPPRHGVGQVIGVLALYVLFRWTLGVLRLPLGTPGWLLLIAGAVTAIGGIGLPIWGIASLVRVNRSVGAALGVAALGLGLWLGPAAAGIAAPGGGRFLVQAVAAFQDLGKILAAAGAGVALAAALREPNILLPAGAFAAFADFVVVRFGTVKHALSTPKGQQLVQAVSANLPAVHPQLPLLTIGPADFLFLGVFLACADRFGMGLKRNALILTAVLALSLMLVLVVPAIPALAPMSIAFLAANWRHFRLTRSELLSTALVLVLMGGLFLGYFLLLFPGRR